LIVRDVLNEENVKVRAEIVVHFIKVAKRLQELNNLNSLVAIVLALQSPPIIRLQNTWKIVPKKDKINFERLTEFISEEDN
jgi:ribosome-associated toxin RatA of RatAB toxin-antitoxin module